uniref:L,D-transpeptidase n=1 Tax=Paenibacillus psychroresistens TaxID=1778678 RepID=UPI0013910DF5|nr:L,D-transpeptidase [Paenibacillus psychroresistens]
MEGLEQEDPLYLKNFVKVHPENKMGWYLLGKQYESQGKEGKAKYCFAQAGDVYSAFEMTNPIQLDASEKALDPNSIPEQKIVHKMNRLKQRIKIAYRAVIVASLVIFALTYLPADALEEASEDLEDIAVAEADLESGLNVFYIEDGSISNDIQKALNTMITPNGKEKKLSIIVKAPKSADGQWVMWQKTPAPLLSAERDANSGKLIVSYHDSAVCECTAVGGAAALRTVKSWKQQQEQLSVLRSTMAAYEKANGKLPAKADSMTNDYPKNIIPGLSEVMRKAYPYYTVADSHKVIMKNNPIVDINPTPLPMATNQPEDEVKLPTDDSKPSTIPKATAKPAAAQNATANYEIVPPLDDPLEIVVDPQTHQLALVSGKVIVRKYSIGLGGEKTPQGSFTITEKVRSPNGHDNGDFGSRGMTLSDTLYAIHGTNKPSSIGLDESLGCIRMLKEDIEELFDMAPLGTKVTIGKVKLPLEPTTEKTRFHSPHTEEETNPGRIYKWLN